MIRSLAVAAALGATFVLAAPSDPAAAQGRGASAGDRPAYEYDGPQNPARRGRPPRGVSQEQHDRGGRADVNAAFMGGGVILEGAPGAPAPMPEPTPPGQRPRNMVDPGTPMGAGSMSGGSMSGGSMGSGSMGGGSTGSGMGRSMR